MHGLCRSVSSSSSRIAWDFFFFLWVYQHQLTNLQDLRATIIQKIPMIPIIWRTMEKFQDKLWHSRTPLNCYNFQNSIIINSLNQNGRCMKNSFLYVALFLISIPSQNVFFPYTLYQFHYIIKCLHSESESSRFKYYSITLWPFY